MGKKRRLLTTKKFRAKHSAHPRMRCLSTGTPETTDTPVEIVEEEVKVVEAAIPALTLTPEVVETKATTPKAPKAKKKTTRKKTTTSTRKRSTKKKTTTATA